MAQFMLSVTPKMMLQLMALVLVLLVLMFQKLAW